MAINLATKYSSKVDERFKLKSFTESAVNQDYDWEGVNSIKVYSISTVATVAYGRNTAYTGGAITSRYGNPLDLPDTTATYTMSQDKAFTFIVDKLDKMDSMGVREAGKALARQNDEVVVPEIDTYRITKWCANSVTNNGKPAAPVVITASNAYSSFLAAGEYLDENKVPTGSRIAFVTPRYYNFLKQDPSFLSANEIAQEAKINGQIGEVDGVKIVKVPSTYFPASTPFVVVHPSAMVAPKKLQDYKIHENPPGINGNLVEGRVYYDAFILDAKKKATYCWKEA